MIRDGPGHETPRRRDPRPSRSVRVPAEIESATVIDRHRSREESPADRRRPGTSRPHSTGRAAALCSQISRSCSRFVRIGQAARIDHRFSRQPVAFRRERIVDHPPDASGRRAVQARDENQPRRHLRPDAQLARIGRIVTGIRHEAAQRQPENGQQRQLAVDCRLIRAEFGASGSACSLVKIGDWARSSTARRASGRWPKCRCAWRREHRAADRAAAPFVSRASYSRAGKDNR